MRVLSSILRHAVYPAMSRAGLFPRSLGAGEVCVLTYHGVLPEGFGARKSPIDETLVSAEQFRRQLRFLKSRYRLITPEEFHNWCTGDGTLPERAVLLTCDDGLLNALTDMVPILREEGARGLFFFTGAAAEDEPSYLWHDELYQMLANGDAERLAEARANDGHKIQIRTGRMRAFWQDLVREFSGLSSPDRCSAMCSLRGQLGIREDWRVYEPGDVAAERRYRLLNRTELGQLAAQGMTVGAHTMSHPVLSRMTPELVEREIQECRSRLESCLRREVWAMAYPFGDASSTGAREMEIAAQVGYTCAFLNYGGGCFRASSPRFGLPRAHVTSEMRIPEIEACLTGFHARLRRRFRGNLAAESAANGEGA